MVEINYLKLQKAQQQLRKYKKDEVSLNNELGRIQSKVQKAMNRIRNESKQACMMRRGMTKYEVRSILGNPSGMEMLYSSGDRGRGEC